jgi:hypothetical protein
MRYGRGEIDGLVVAGPWGLLGEKGVVRDVATLLVAKFAVCWW